MPAAGAPAQPQGAGRSRRRRIASFLCAVFACAALPACAVTLPPMRAEGLDPAMVEAARAALSCVPEPRWHRDATLTLIDYGRPSTERRLWTVALADGRLLFHEHVAHGSGTGENHARSFSNVPGSRQSSLGLFKTADTYYGRNGYSLRLDGLDPGVNHLARERAIVIHGAPYVSEETIGQLGRLGRSWGCPAVHSRFVRAFIDRIAGGSYVFAYHPSESRPASCERGRSRQ